MEWLWITNDTKTDKNQDGNPNSLSLYTYYWPMMESIAISGSFAKGLFWNLLFRLHKHVDVGPAEAEGKETLGSESYGLPYGKATICVVMFNIYVSDSRITIQRKVLLVYHNMKWRCANKYEKLNNESHIGAPWECTLISSKALKYIHIKVQIHMSSCKHPQKYA